MKLELSEQTLKNLKLLVVVGLIMLICISFVVGDMTWIFSSEFPSHGLRFMFLGLTAAGYGIGKL